jgi:uncharacterized membrane protein
VSKSADTPHIYSRGAYWLIGIGIAGALLAAVLGLLDLFTIPRGTKAWRTGLIHAALNDVVLVCFAVGFYIRRESNFADGTSTGLMVLSAVALVLLAVSGWLGGKLAYRWGVRVADEATQAEGVTPPTPSMGTGVAEGQ